MVLETWVHRCDSLVPRQLGRRSRGEVDESWQREQEEARRMRERGDGEMAAGNVGEKQLAGAGSRICQSLVSAAWELHSYRDVRYSSARV